MPVVTFFGSLCSRHQSSGFSEVNFWKFLSGRRHTNYASLWWSVRNNNKTDSIAEQTVPLTQNFDLRHRGNRWAHFFHWQTQSFHCLSLRSWTLVWLAVHTSMEFKHFRMQQLPRSKFAIFGNDACANRRLRISAAAPSFCLSFEAHSLICILGHSPSNLFTRVVTLCLATCLSIQFPIQLNTHYWKWRSSVFWFWLRFSFCQKWRFRSEPTNVSARNHFSCF